MPPSKPKIRLFVNGPFVQGQPLALSAGQSHYLAHVMRCREGDGVAVFNGRDGEWEARITEVGKKTVTLLPARVLAAQKASPDIWLAFVPIRNKTELVVEKAVELGVGRLLPVMTRHAVARSVNMEKLRAHAVEAAEQCGRHDVPEITGCVPLPDLLASWPGERTLLYADESGEGEDMKTLLPQLPGHHAYGLLVGPEGGFAGDERRQLCALPFVRPFCLGPRILRADTAAVAALACVQAWVGDWAEKPHFEAAS